MSDDPLSASRLYAVTEAGRMECPRCRKLLVWGTTANHPDAKYWNPVSSRLTCYGCNMTYTLGVIAWPSERAGKMPPDQQFSLRQLSELRQRAGGYWPRKRLEKGGASNRFVAEGCCCAPLPWRRECLVHGGVGVDSE